MKPIGGRSIRSRAGHTIVELAVAMTILAAGSAVLWYGIRSSAQMDKLNGLHRAALLAARSEMESLRLRAKESIHDTSYMVTGPGGEPLQLVRLVFDSARIMSSLQDVALDEKLRPQELHKPLEVMVRVLLNPAGAEAGASASDVQEAWRDDFGSETRGDEDGKPRSLVTLVLKLPEYKWY